MQIVCTVQEKVIFFSKVFFWNRHVLNLTLLRRAHLNLKISVQKKTTTMCAGGLIFTDVNPLSDIIAGKKGCIAAQRAKPDEGFKHGKHLLLNIIEQESGTRMFVKEGVKNNHRLGSQISFMNNSSSCGVVVLGNKRMLILDAEMKPFQNVESHSRYYRNYRKISAFKAISPVQSCQWILGIKGNIHTLKDVLKYFSLIMEFVKGQKLHFAPFVHVSPNPHLFIWATSSTLRLAKANVAERRWAAFLKGHSFTYRKVIKGGVVQNKFYFFSSKTFDNQFAT